MLQKCLGFEFITAQTSEINHLALKIGLSSIVKRYLWKISIHYMLEPKA